MDKQKVLIISYFFFPCNLPGAHRTFSWAKHLHESGLLPIVVTRNWDRPLKNRNDLFMPTGESVIHKVEDGYEVYYLPFKGGIRDMVLNRFGEDKMILLRKALTYFELIAQNFTTRLLAFRNFYTFSRQLISNDPSIKIIITSAMPFALFSICHKLHKKTGLPWIADYRDDWNTTSWTSNYNIQSHITGKRSIADSILAFFDTKSEKRWLSSASMVTTVSKYYVNKISNYVLRPARVIYNGHDIDQTTLKEKTNNKFTVSYIGTLYWKQRIEIFFDGMAKAIAELKTNEIEIIFAGTGYDLQQCERIKKYVAAKNIPVTITGWLSEQEVLDIVNSSQLLLSISYDGVKGVIPSKVFNYLAFRKPVLLCPSDHDELEEALTASGLGIIANDAESCSRKVVEVYKNYMANQTTIHANQDLIDSFSRRNQAKKLGSIIHTIIGSA
ncbi:MAG: glycosyltransferase [Chitinophagaceae bacterium]|nr:glycosyltransferase [Chitinophagaceae bacterium]